jgi:hypothetical protein
VLDLAVGDLVLAVDAVGVVESRTVTLCPARVRARYGVGCAGPSAHPGLRPCRRLTSLVGATLGVGEASAIASS